MRAVLADNPNDPVAFGQLAEIVRRRAAESQPGGDPLAAPKDEQEAAEVRQEQATLAVWSLAEELAGNPRAWFPLVELARLSIDDDPDAALRRLATASDRDPTGAALAAGLDLLRTSGHANDALGLGVGHWRPREHVLDAGVQVVLSAVDAGRVGEARTQLAILDSTPHRADLQAVRGELERAIESAQRRTARG